jgi:hypothetical protein
MTTREILENIEEAIVIAKDCSYHKANEILCNIAELWGTMSQHERDNNLWCEGHREAMMRFVGVYHYDAELDEALKNYLAIL